MIYIYFIVSFMFTSFSLSGFEKLSHWWQKIIVTIFYACICMAWLPMCMGKILYKVYEKYN